MATVECSPQKEDNRRRKDSTKSVVLTEGKRGSAGSNQEGEASPKVNKKFIENWRHACDRTRDRTKELLKKWRTLPEPSAEDDSIIDEDGKGWSEHVWMDNYPSKMIREDAARDKNDRAQTDTWVKRYPSGEDSQETNTVILNLTTIQKLKFVNFFVHLLDMDSDEVISVCDFENLFERFRHFADWSKNSPEYHRLLEVQSGFVEYFLLPPELAGSTKSYKALEKAVRKEQLEIEEWLIKWSNLLDQTQNFLELPLWLQYFPIILFQVINKSGTGDISKEELSTFYSSVVGLSEHQLSQTITNVFDNFTSNGKHKLDIHVYRLCFANFILGKFPNGPGQFLLYPIMKTEETFPIDYKAMSCALRDLEQYSPEVKTNRRSVIV